MAALVAAVALGAACDGDNSLITPTTGRTTPTATVEATPTTSATATPSETPTPTETPEPQQQLQSLLLSIFTSTNSEADQRALAQMEVISVPVENADRDLWAAVTSGPGVWEFSTESGHVAAVYERREDGGWVEVTVLPLQSGPTLADIAVLDAPQPPGGVAWIAVNGFTGAHGGTFELLRFDGVSLVSTLWWFSPSPAAAAMADLDGDGVDEVLLDASDPYVYCYACSVTAWSEIIYRWVGGEPVAVNLGPVETDNARARALTEQASALVEADLWARARATMQLAVDAAPEDEDIRWMQRAIDRTAAARLEDAGAPQQPVTTAVLAGEYDLAVSLMAEHAPAEAFDPAGPLVAGTVAEGWGETMGLHLLDYAGRALQVDPQLAPAYAVRALGRMLLDEPDPAAALMDMEAAMAIVPGNEFYRAAYEYLLDRNGGAAG